jgi:hypothetical protein
MKKNRAEQNLRRRPNLWPRATEAKNAPLAMFSGAQNQDSTGTKTWTEIANHSSSRMKHDRQKPRTKISWKKIAQN